ncbi:restriction endonuclease subunit S [Mycoplasma sp. 5912]
MDKKVPSLRFNGFEDEWEQQLFKDIYVLGKSGGTPLTTNKKYYSGNIPFLTIKDITNSEKLIKNTEKRISEEGLNNSNAWLVPRNSLNMSIYASIGKIAINKENLATSQAIFSFILKNNKLLDFYFYNLFFKNFKRHWNKVLSTGTQPNLSSEMVNKAKIWKSSNERENILIGSIFSSLDSLLLLHQQKYDFLMNIKSTLLSKMFPNQNSKFPNIRFSEFTHAWEQEVLESLFDSYGGTSLEDYFDNFSPYKVISIGSFAENFTYRDQGLRIDLNEKSSKYILKKGDLAMIMNDKTPEGKIIGSCLLIDKDDTFIYNQRTQKLSPRDDKINSSFAYILLNYKRNRNKIIRDSQGKTQIYINWSSVKNITHKITSSLPEQQKISQLFSSLDSILSLHQRKLQIIKNIKKKMLEKMFV